MKQIHYTYEFRIYPNKEQEILLNKHFGSARFLYNHFLQERNLWYLTHKESEKKSLNYHDNSRSLTQLKKNPEYAWLKEVNAQCLQQSLRHLDTSFTRFFHKISGFPSFKKKTSKQSITIPQNFSFENGLLWIPKFKQGIRLVAHRKMDGDPLHITIKKNPTGKYFVCILVEKQIKELKKIKFKIGIDLGLKDFLVDSNGNKISNPSFLRKAEKVLKYEQRQLSKKVKGSKSREKQRIIVAKCHEKVRNSRKDFLHKLSSKLIGENQVICLESLAIKNMVKNHKLAKSISDAGWGMFTEMLKYKAEWYGRTISQIDRFYPSSKLCSACGLINSDLALKGREWKCDCGVVHDRDFNAAKNILRQGLNLVTGSGIESVKK